MIVANPHITNLVELLGLQHSNPLGIAPVWQLVFIAVVALVMEFFLHQIRWRQKPQYYPVMFALLAVATISLYYYCFQGGLPEAHNLSHGGSYEALCWFCDHELVGWGWAIVGIVASIVVTYILLCAVQQACAQLTMYADPAQVVSKPWKEFKFGIFVALLPVILVLIGLMVKPSITSWMFLAGCFCLLAFVVVKAILDSRRTKSVAWGISINLVFLLTMLPICILSVGMIECAYAFIIGILALFTGAKARKKEPKKSE